MLTAFASKWLNTIRRLISLISLYGIDLELSIKVIPTSELLANAEVGGIYTHQYEGRRGRNSC